MDITITLPDKDFPNAFASVYHYQETITDGEKEVENPQSKDDFFNQKLQDFCEDVFIADVANQQQIAVQENVASAKADYNSAKSALLKG